MTDTQKRLIIFRALRKMATEPIPDRLIRDVTK